MIETKSLLESHWNSKSTYADKMERQEVENKGKKRGWKQGLEVGNYSTINWFSWGFFPHQSGYNVKWLKASSEHLHGSVQSLYIFKRDTHTHIYMLHRSLVFMSFDNCIYL